MNCVIGELNVIVVNWSDRTRRLSLKVKINYFSLHDRMNGLTFEAIVRPFVGWLLNTHKNKNTQIFWKNNFSKLEPNFLFDKLLLKHRIGFFANRRKKITF